MPSLFDRHVRLFDGLVYDRDVYDRRPGCDPELICRGLEPVTDIERRGMALLNDVDADILTHKLSSIVEEARDVYMALSISEGIITGDMNCGIFTAQGDPVVVGTGIYFHTLLNNAQLKYILKYYRDDPSVGLADGDIFFFNEELAGGIHNMDMFSAMPIFWEGELVAWAEVGGHQGDTGSITPGGFAPTAKSRYEEGFHMPAVRIGRDFRLRQDVLDYMSGTVRNSLVFAADLKSRVATLFQIRRRFLREIERRGVEQVVGGMRRVLVRGEENARARLREIDDGIFRSVLFNDDHGTFFGLTRVPVVGGQGGRPACRRPAGRLAGEPRGAVQFELAPDPGGDGGLPVLLFLPGAAPRQCGASGAGELLRRGAVDDERPGRARARARQPDLLLRHPEHVHGRRQDAVRAASTARPCRRRNRATTRSPSSAGSTGAAITASNFGGNANAGGGGGRYDMDGEHALGFYWGPWTDAGEVEEQDERLPHLILSRKLDKNFHGFGKFRGGTPLLEVAMGCGEADCAMSSWGSCDKLSFNYGLFGGYAGPPNPRLVIRERRPRRTGEGGRGHRARPVRAARGEAASVATTSLPPRRRTPRGSARTTSWCIRSAPAAATATCWSATPTLVLADLADELITSDVAEKIYGVVRRQVPARGSDEAGNGGEAPRAHPQAAPGEGQEIRRLHPRLEEETPARDRARKIRPLARTEARDLRRAVLGPLPQRRGRPWVDRTRHPPSP